MHSSKVNVSHLLEDPSNPVYPSLVFPLMLQLQHTLKNLVTGSIISMSGNGAGRRVTASENELAVVETAHKQLRSEVLHKMMRFPIMPQAVICPLLGKYHVSFATFSFCCCRFKNGHSIR
ncbi:hypothetical protein C0J52_06000 [Blattella germanica]|nr:hypothetical protein C0J52_06000 [Blattella germanica]